MGPLPQGSRNVHIKASQGPDINMMKFYITQNSTTYGRYHEKFKPRSGRHTGTGYLSNFRPAVYYNQRLDQTDNPTLADICSKNYHTVTELEFQPYKENSGKEPLPGSVHQVGSGFVRQKPITFSTEADGPKYMVSETYQRFKGDQPDRKCSQHVDVSMKTVGHPEGTGFTHAYNVEPITFIPADPHKNDKPGWHTGRPTGISIMKTDFLRSEYPHGDEPLPNLAAGSDRGTGFTREKAKPLYVHRNPKDAYDRADDIPDLRLQRTKKTDPTDYLNMVHPNNYSSITKDVFRGQQRPSQNEADRLERTGVGKQELSGYSENNDRFVAVNDDYRRFTTHYMTRFGPDPTPYGKDREGHTRGGIQQQKPDGFTKSTSVHSHGPDIQSTETLRRLEPYVSRSIKARDAFYDDHTHDAKMHRSVTICG